MVQSESVPCLGERPFVCSADATQECSGELKEAEYRTPVSPIDCMCKMIDMILQCLKDRSSSTLKSEGTSDNSASDMGDRNVACSLRL
jgi:hypothetical protein